METYTFLRELADSYVLAILFAIFLGVIAFAFRPGSRPIHDDAAMAPFRHDDDAPTVRASCPNACEGCACGDRIAPLDFLKEYSDV